MPNAKEWEDDDVSIVGCQLIIKLLRSQHVAKLESTFVEKSAEHLAIYMTKNIFNPYFIFSHDPYITENSLQLSNSQIQWCTSDHSSLIKLTEKKNQVSKLRKKFFSPQTN